MRPPLLNPKSEEHRISDILVVEYRAELKVHLWEYIGIIQGLQYPSNFKGCPLYY